MVSNLKQGDRVRVKDCLDDSWDTVDERVFIAHCPNELGSYPYVILNRDTGIIDKWGYAETFDTERIELVASIRQFAEKTLKRKPDTLYPEIDIDLLRSIESYMAYL